MEESKDQDGIEHGIAEAFNLGRMTERGNIISWLRLKMLSASSFPDTDPEGHRWALAGDWADAIGNEEHLKCES
jgi:hypothetical protein